MDFSEYKAFLFDMDGVLFDSMPYHAQAWSDTFAHYGIKFTPYQVYLQEGCTGPKTINDVFLSQKGRLATDEEINGIYQLKCRLFEQSGDPVPMPYTAEVIAAVQAKGIRVGLVTGSGQATLLQTLNTYYPGVFAPERMVTAYDVKQGKPDPEPYLMALKKMGLLANQAVVVENAPMGVQSAKGAGIFTIGVNTGILKREDLQQAGADIVLDNMQQLWQLLSD